MKRIQLAPHLTKEELGDRLKGSSDARIFKRWQMLYSMACNPEKTTDEIAQVLGIPIYTLRRTVELYNKGGADFQEKLHWGGRRRETAFLSLEQEAEMMEGFKDKALKGEILTAKDIKKDVEMKLNREVSDDYLWALFRRHQWKKKAPRPKHTNQNPQAQEEFKKNSRNF